MAVYRDDDIRPVGCWGLDSDGNVEALVPERDSAKLVPAMSIDGFVGLIFDDDLDECEIDGAPESDAAEADAGD
jgi:hypothetical protein